jgi:Holliday junction DNA helicase RuvB
MKSNIIFATTDAHMMFKPLLNRCKEIYFNRYNEDELLDILKMYVGDIKLDCDLDTLAEACRGRARDAFSLSQDIIRYCSDLEDRTFIQEHWEELMNILDIHPMGINAQEMLYLKTIAESSPISSKNLAIKMGVNIENIEEELEVRPRELGLIETSSKGRSITEEGLKYLEATK